MAVSTDVEASQQALRDPPGILVNEQDGTESDQQNENTLAELEGSNQPQQTPLRGVVIGFRCRRGHPVAKTNVRISRLVRAAGVRDDGAVVSERHQSFFERTAARSSFTISREARIAAAC